MPSSLRGRLLLAGVLGVVLSAAASAVLLGAAFERAAQRAFDRALDDDLDALIGLAQVAADGRVVLRREPSGERYDRVFSGWYWQIGEGKPQQQSRSLWDSADLAIIASAAGGERSYARVDGPRQQQLRVAVQRVRFDRAQSPQVFAVAGDLAQVQAEVADFRWLAAFAVALIAATLLLALLVQVQFGLRPFQRLAATVERIRRGEDIRFGRESLPHEIVPLAAQIDVLLDEHAVRVQRARHAAQDLAHALKTPLAVLTMECERPRPDMATRVADQVARMQVAITHHLAGASAADRRQRTAITPVVDGLLDAMRRIHAARGIAFSADIADEAVFAGSVEDLEEMLGNLLDNAGKWARTQVRIASAQTTDHHLLVSIEDDGPGMDEAAVQRALQRGVRLDERIPGSGLGLDIVEGMTRNHDGEMLIDRSALGGLRVRLRFPAAD